ncbi:MAG: fibronectin type III domain-containing protein [Nitrospiraceae bacterium]
MASPTAPSTSASAGGSGPTPSPAGRGFTNLLNRFPTLGPTLQIAPPPVPAAVPDQTPAAPGATPPVPLVNAPAPQNTPSPGTVYGQIVLRWNANPESDLSGYKIYVGTQSGRYDYPGSPFNVGRTTTTTISNLPRGTTYYFSASAYDTSGNESGRSPEISKSLY